MNSILNFWENPPVQPTGDPKKGQKVDFLNARKIINAALKKAGATA